jgi:hypothetical protein
MKKIIVLVLLIFALNLLGCMGLGTQIKMEEKRNMLIREKILNTYSENIQEAIRDGKIMEGMNQDQVLLAIGPTGCISNGIHGGNQVEVWIYQFNPFKGKPMGKSGICQRDSGALWKDTVVYFENNNVVGWENL